MEKRTSIEYSNFKEYAGSVKPEVYQTIMQQISQAMSGSDSLVSRYYEIVREYPERPSGYRRPALAMLVAEMFGIPREQSRLLAAALQLTQEWVLIHDDIMDGSETRSNQPTLSKKYGEAIAIDAGDTLHIIASKMLSDFRVSAGQIGEQIYGRMYTTLLRTADGQFMDLDFVKSKKGLSDVSMEMYLHIVKEKTCRYSVMDPIVFGAMLAEQPQKMIGALEVVGAHAGIAFQIMDDILDIVADEAKFGKQRYGDLYEGKLTAIILYAYQNASEDERARIDAIYSKKREDKTEEDIQFLVDTITKYDAVMMAKDLADHYGTVAEMALEDLSSTLPDNIYKRLFVSAIREMYTREK